MAPMYYRGAQAAIVVYDITNQVSLQCVLTNGDGIEPQGQNSHLVKSEFQGLCSRSTLYSFRADTLEK